MNRTASSNKKSVPASSPSKSDANPLRMKDVFLGLAYLLTQDDTEFPLARTRGFVPGLGKLTWKELDTCLKKGSRGIGNDPLYQELLERFRGTVTLARLNPRVYALNSYYLSARAKLASLRRAGDLQRFIPPAIEPAVVAEIAPPARRGRPPGDEKPRVILRSAADCRPMLIQANLFSGDPDEALERDPVSATARADHYLTALIKGPVRAPLAETLD